MTSTLTPATEPPGPSGGIGGADANGSAGDTPTPPEPNRRRRSRVPLISAAAVGCVTALLIAVLATSKNASTRGTFAATPLENKLGPDISGPTLDGGSASLWGLRGKWVLVNFFASWCVPCQQEQPDLVKFQDTHSSGDAVILGVRFDDPDTGPIRSLMSKSGATWPIVDDPNAKIVYSVTGPPESFLISPSGIVVGHIIGAISDSRLEQLLQQEKLVVTTPTSAPATSLGPPALRTSASAANP